MKKCVLRNFIKFTGKHLCQSLFFNEVKGLRPVTLLKETLAQVFSCEFHGISKNTFLQGIFLLLITDELDIYKWVEGVSCCSKLTSRMSVFNNHPSIWLIKDKCKKSSDFKFKFVSTNQDLKYINEIDFYKISGRYIPAQIIKMTNEELTVTISLLLHIVFTILICTIKQTDKPTDFHQADLAFAFPL